MLRIVLTLFHVFEEDIQAQAFSLLASWVLF